MTDGGSLIANVVLEGGRVNGSALAGAVGALEGAWYGIVRTNTMESAWSLFDRAVIGAYHKLSAKHLPVYLSEFEWRFNNRENPYLFRDTLTRLLAADALRYKELIA